jgi:hypothetical protein
MRFVWLAMDKGPDASDPCFGGWHSFIMLEIHMAWLTRCLSYSKVLPALKMKNPAFTPKLSQSYNLSASLVLPAGSAVGLLLGPLYTLLFATGTGIMY